MQYVCHAQCNFLFTFFVGVSTFPSSARFPKLVYNESLTEPWSDYYNYIVEQIQGFVSKLLRYKNKFQ